jgi:hypothetical protein
MLLNERVKSLISSNKLILLVYLLELLLINEDFRKRQESVVVEVKTVKSLNLIASQCSNQSCQSWTDSRLKC